MRTIVLFIVLMFCSAASYALSDLRYYTEEYPPYNFTSNGKINGIAVDMLLQASQLVESEVDLKSIKLYPWPRDYRIVRSTPNTVLFSTARITHREPLFKWAGPIGETRIVVLAKKINNIEITQPSDITNYSLGVVLDDIGEQLAMKAGVPLERMDHANTAVPLVKMLYYDRVQLIAYEEQVVLWSIEKAGLDIDEFEVVGVLETVNLYYAFNLETSDVYVEKMQRGIDLLKQNKDSNGKSAYDNIVDKYMNWRED